MEKRPSIAHILPWGGVGGVEIATTRIISATSDRFRHVAFCLADAKDVQDICMRAGAEVVTYAPPMPSLRHANQFYRESKIISDELARHGIGVVHLSDIKAGFHTSLAAVLARTPILCHVRSRFPNLSTRERLAFSPVTRYVFVSQDSRRQFGIQVPDSKARIVYDAVDVVDDMAESASLPVRAELGIGQEAPLIGMVARVNPQKDYDTLAAAAAIVVQRRPDAHFLIVGDNSIVELNRKHYAHVSGVLAQLGIEDKFTFTGLRNDVPRLVSAMDVFVLSTHREGLPLSILEAMAKGKPIVATEVDGIPEVITQGVTGLMHKHEDSQGLADAILACINDPKRALEMGNAAREECRRAYSEERFARDMANVYEELLAKR